MITVFTPVYNRAHTMGRLYRSLLGQTSRDFEWLVIDDGSTDHVGELAEQWMKNTKEFKIRFCRQPNGGKHRAVNRGVQLAEGEGFLIVDSDDYLTEDAIDTASRYWNQIKEDPGFAGTAGLRLHSDMQVIGDAPRFGEFVDATNLERAAYGLRGDKAEVYKTSILREFPFPEFEGEKFVTEAVVWNRIAYQGYKIRWFHKGIIICDYLEDGLTAGGDRLFWDSPRGWAAYLRGERVHQAWGGEAYARQCFFFYEKEHLKLDEFQMAELLGAGEKEMNEIARAHRDIQKKLVDLCREKAVCIYGYGAWGKRLGQYLAECRIPVSCVVDRQKLDTKGLPLYSPDGELPEADVAFVALKKGAEDIVPVLKEKIKQARIVRVDELVGKWW